MSKKKPGQSSYNAVNPRSHKQNEEAKADDFNKLYHTAQPSRGQKNSRVVNSNSTYNHNSNKGASAQYTNSSSYRDDRRDAINNSDYRAERNDIQRERETRDHRGEGRETRENRKGS